MQPCSHLRVEHVRDEAGAEREGEEMSDIKRINTRQELQIEKQARDAGILEDYDDD